MEKADLVKRQYRLAEIKKKRAQVRQHLISASPNVTGGKLDCLADSDLELLFRLYDSFFLEGYLQSSKFRGNVKFTISTRMRTNAGQLVYPKNRENSFENYELKIGINLFFQYDSLLREKMVNGIKTRDALEALQLVFEHELCHLIEVHCFQKSNCSQVRFKTIAYNLFGHTASNHQLPTSREIAVTQYAFRIGDRVCFTYQGKKYKGFIANINVRATVLVADQKGSYEDKQGCRYNKWYIPLAMLKKNRQ